MEKENGVWRTVRGRRVFIRNGQSLTDAMKESGKFENSNQENLQNKLKKHFGKTNSDNVDDSLSNRDLYDKYYDNIAETLAKVESEKMTLDHEVGTIIDLKGNVINVTEGQEHSVDPPDELLKGNIFTHNHPLGFCFSSDDIKGFVNKELFEVRVSTPQGTFHSLMVDDENYSADIVQAFENATSVENVFSAIKMDFEADIITKDEANKLNTALKYYSHLAEEFLTDYARDYGFVYKKGRIR